MSLAKMENVTSLNSSLEALPMELLHRVFAMLDTKDVCAARAASSMLATIGSEYLLDKIHTSVRKDDLERLLQISQHPIISKQIRSLQYDAEMFHHQPQSFDVWNGMSNVFGGRVGRGGSLLVPRVHQSGRRCTEQDLIEAYDAYKRLVSDQAHLLDSKADVGYFIQLFRNCPRLDDVTITINSSNHASICQNTSAFQQVLSCPHLDTENRRQGEQPINAIADAAHVTCKALKRLTLKAISYLVLRQESQVLHKIADMMRPLHELRIELEPYGQALNRILGSGTETLGDAIACFGEGQLQVLLSAASDLRVLEISFTNEGGYDVGIVPLRQATDNITWQHLRQLRLDQVLTTEDDLHCFLTRHRHSLEGLTLRNMDFEAGTWESLFKRISCIFPHLERINLRGLYYSESLGAEFEFPFDDVRFHNHHERDAIEKYILDGGEYPDTEALKDVDIDAEEISYESDSDSYDTDENDLDRYCYPGLDPTGWGLDSDDDLFYGQDADNPDTHRHPRYDHIADYFPQGEPIFEEDHLSGSIPDVHEP